MGRRYIIALVITLVSTAAAPGTQPAATARGLAGSPPSQERAVSHGPNLQAPEAVAQVGTRAVTTIHAETDQQRETAEWALEQMAAAGLAIPPVTIHMHSERSDCGNRPGEESNGYYMRRADEHIIHSCGSAWILVHELGHLWDTANLDDETRQRILDYQELESWSHQQWDQAGGEHLASIIAWAIEGTHPSSIGYYDQDHLAKVYTLATGSNPPILGGGPAETRTNLNSDQDALIESALGRFEAHGLTPPAIDWVGYDSDEACFGRPGAAIDRGERTEIRLCLDGTGAAHDWVVLHELAHAWDHRSLDDSTRNAFLELRGLDSWRGDDWHDNGAEHAAEIMVWGLIDRPVQLVRIPQNSCEELSAAYSLLTDRAPARTCV